MRRIDALLRILALSSVLILALGGFCATSEEDAGDASDTGDPPIVEGPPPDEAPG